MTKQITIKLNYKQFRPVLDSLVSFSGEGMYESDSDIVGKSLFYCYRATNIKHKDVGKTTYEVMTERRGMSKSEALLEFLEEYYRFKKEGLPNIQKKQAR